MLVFLNAVKRNRGLDTVMWTYCVTSKYMTNLSMNYTLTLTQSERGLVKRTRPKKITAAG